MQVLDYYDMWPAEWGLQKEDYHSQLITCPVPKAHGQDVPKAVSLQSRGDCHHLETSVSNVLRVVQSPKPSLPRKKRSIGVCVQALRFGTYDVSVRLVEWLELVRLMGADKVHMYLYSATQNMYKVLRHYQKDVWTIGLKILFF